MLLLLKYQPHAYDLSIWDHFYVGWLRLIRFYCLSRKDVKQWCEGTLLICTQCSDNPFGDQHKNSRCSVSCCSFLYSLIFPPPSWISGSTDDLYKQCSWSSPIVNIQTVPNRLLSQWPHPSIFLSMDHLSSIADKLPHKHPLTNFQWQTSGYQTLFRHCQALLIIARPVSQSLSLSDCQYCLSLQHHVWPRINSLVLLWLFDTHLMSLFSVS